MTRRSLIRLGLVAPIPYVLGACSTRSDSGSPATRAPTTTNDVAAPGTTGDDATLAPTPECRDDDDPTVAQTEGPYFTPGSPERMSLLEPGMGGTRLVLTGTVLSVRCQPVRRALVDFWQADSDGNYDTRGFRLRGHQFTDERGSYRLETVVPGVYIGRTRHIHVKVQAPERRVLTTQLYFPGEAGNSRDRIYRPELLVRDIQATAERREASFTFVVDA